MSKFKQKKIPFISSWIICVMDTAECVICDLTTARFIVIPTASNKSSIMATLVFETLLNRFWCGILTFLFNLKILLIFIFWLYTSTFSYEVRTYLLLTFLGLFLSFGFCHISSHVFHSICDYVHQDANYFLFFTCV